MRSRPPDTLQDRQVGDLKILRLLWPFLWPRDEPRLRLMVIGAMVSLVVMAGINAFVPILFATAVDALAESKGEVVAAPVALILVYGFLHWGGKLINEARWALYGPIEQRIQRRIGLAALRHLHDLSLRFHLDRRTGQLARILDNGLRGVRELLFDAIFLILPFLAEILLITGVVVQRYDGIYALIMSATLGAYGFALVIGSAIVRRRQRQAVAEGARAHGEAIDSLLNYETIKLFGNEEHVADRYDGSLARVERLTVRALLTRSAMGMVQVTIVAAGLTAMTLLAGREVAAGSLSVGDFVLVNTYLLQLLRPLERLGNLYRSIKTEMANVELLVLLFDDRSEIVDAPGAQPLAPGPGGLVFRNVSFAYDPRVPVLRDVSFALAPGNAVAIVGPTGAGKSTIGRLLFRFYDPTGGSILIDGRDLREVPQDSLRSAIGVVPQEPVLFNETIGFNIGFGRPGASRAEVEAAARTAEIHDFIAALPDGYDTLVGERGLKVSGGEKQRIAIARVILKDPRILLLDEASSSLDVRTEARIHDNLHGLARRRTTVIIAHRLSTIVGADQILFLEDGRVAEHGTHEALLALDGHYAQLWRQQLRQRDRPGDRPWALQDIPATE